MTPLKAHQQTQAAADSDIESRCLLYLLGEMDSEAARRFEERLAADGRLCETLMQQADLILAASSVPAATVVVPEQPVVPGRFESGTSESRHWRWIAALASIAACIGMLFHIARPASEHGKLASTRGGGLSESLIPDDETSLIAKAWAISQREATSRRDDDVDPVSDDAVDFEFDYQPSDFDTTLSWMFVAVASSDDLQNEEGNDG